MTWSEYYDNYYDWSESTRIKKLSSIESLGAPDEVTEIMVDFAFNHEDVVNRIAKKAIEQKIIFSADNIADLTNIMDENLQIQLVKQSSDHFSSSDLEKLIGLIDDDVVVTLYKSKGYKIPEEYSYLDDCDDFEEDDVTEEPAEDKIVDGKAPGRLFSNLAIAFGVGAGISQGIKDATRRKPKKFRVGDHVRVKYRGQEGTIVDINGNLYMVSLKGGKYVDSYEESQLEKAW